MAHDKDLNGIIPTSGWVVGLGLFKAVACFLQELWRPFSFEDFVHSAIFTFLYCTCTRVVSSYSLVYFRTKVLSYESTFVRKYFVQRKTLYACTLCVVYSTLYSACTLLYAYFRKIISRVTEYPYTYRSSKI